MTARLGAGIAAGSAVVFGVGTTFGRLAYDGGSDPLTLVLLRSLAFLAFIGTALILLRRPMRLPRAALLATVWMAGTLAMVSLGYQSSVAFIPVSLAALVFYCYPLMVGLVAALARRDRMSPIKGACLAAAFVGLGLALGPSMEALDWRGILLALTAAFGMTLTMTFGGQALRGNDPLVMSFCTNAWLMALLVTLLLARGEVNIPSGGIGVIGLAGVCLSYVLGYSLWYTALPIVGPVRLAGIFNVEPLVTLAAAWLILGERLSAVQFTGAGLVLGSIVVVALQRSSDGATANA